LSVHQNSIDAYHAEEDRLSRRARAVLSWIREQGPRTDRQIAYGMGFGENLNAVRPRITELIDAALLMEVGDVICPITKKRVRRVDVRRARVQQDFFADTGLDAGIPRCEQFPESTVHEQSVNDCFAGRNAPT
jgi:hypothetical protein